MSFNNIPNMNFSNVQASHKSCAGGGGNTGYFRRGKKGEEDDALVGFAKDTAEDSFEYSLGDEQNGEKGILDYIEDFFKAIIEFIKKLFIKDEKEED